MYLLSEIYTRRENGEYIFYIEILIQLYMIMVYNVYQNSYILYTEFSAQKQFHLLTKLYFSNNV